MDLMPCTDIRYKAAVLFSSVCSCLQWENLSSTHWVASALFYVSILFALVAVILGAQQAMLLPDFDTNKSPDHRASMSSENIAKAQKFIEKMRHTSGTGSRPKYGVVFALQCPIMFLALSVWTFLAGLCTVVAGPFARMYAWGDEAKVLIVFITAAVVCMVGFLSCSFFIHSAFGTAQKAKEEGTVQILKTDEVRPATSV